LRKTRLIRPEYAEQFRCIGPACEDSCCVGWRVDIDQATYEKYQTVSPEPLRVLIDASIVRSPEGPDGKKPAGYGSEMTLEIQSAEYAAAYERYYAPFFSGIPTSWRTTLST